MPATVTIGAFVFGAVLLLLAIVGGGIKLFGAEITGSVGKVARTVAFVLGLAFVSLGISGLEPDPDPDPFPTPTDSVKGMKPEPAQSSDNINIGGMWYDDIGTQYFVTQQSWSQYSFTAT